METARVFTPIDLDQLPEAERYFIYGAGVTGITMHGMLAARGHLVAGYFDTSKTGRVNFLECRPPSMIKEVMKSGDMIVIASIYYMEIEQILRDLGINAYLNGTLLGGPTTHPEMATIRRFVDRFAAPGGVTIDVGANVGDTAIFFARRSRLVYGFEPNPELFDRFASITESYGNIKLVPYAASDRQQRVPLSISGLDLTATASSLELAVGTRSIDIDCVTLDGWCAENEVVPTFIKIDAEFHDVAVIRGAFVLISKYRPLMLMEASGTEAEQELYKELSSIYRIVRVPFLNDPYWDRDYIDAPAFYREHPGAPSANVGFIPLPL